MEEALRNGLLEQLKGADEDTMNMASQVWKKLDDLAENDPDEYRNVF